MGLPADPLLLLIDLEARARQHGAPLPRREQVKSVWSGIAFRLDDTEFAAPLDNVREVLTYPVLSRIPGTKSWVKGIANVRGNLITVLDLKGFLRGENGIVGSRSRVLVIGHAGVFAGLLVDQVIGLKHFFHEQRAELEAPLRGPGQTYVKQGFREGDRLWPVFDLHALAEDPAFLQVAA
jgi:twitching motility protein PilI